MDPDFINVYIDTLIKNLHDLTSKSVVLETKLTYSEKITRELKEKSEALESQVEDLSNNIQAVTNERDVVRTELSTARSTIDALHSLNTEVAFLNNRVRELEEENRVLKNPPPPAVVETKKTKTPKITDLTEVDSFTE